MFELYQKDIRKRRLIIKIMEKNKLKMHLYDIIN
jgi:hypothetical protein